MSQYDLQKAAEHFAARVTYTTGTHELEGLIQQNRSDVVVVDVRFPSDFAKGHVPGAINLPKGKWHTAKGLRKDAVHYVYCYDQTCHLAAEAALEFVKAGYRAVEVEGGFAKWQSAGSRIETPAQAA